MKLWCKNIGTIALQYWFGSRPADEIIGMHLWGRDIYLLQVSVSVKVHIDAARELNAYLREINHDSCRIELNE